MKTNNDVVYSSSEARNNFPSMVKKVKESGGPVYITNRGDIQAVLISDGVFNQLASKFSDSGLAGIWKNREDMRDSVDWVKESRSEEER